MIFMKLPMLQDNCILGLKSKTLLDVSRAFQKTALVADMYFNIRYYCKNNLNKQ